MGMVTGSVSNVTIANTATGLRGDPTPLLNEVSDTLEEQVQTVNLASDTTGEGIVDLLGYILCQSMLMLMRVLFLKNASWTNSAENYERLAFLLHRRGYITPYFS